MDRLAWQIDQCMKLEDCNKALVKSLESLRAAIGDSLLGSGITKEYHGAVFKEISDAIEQYSAIEIKF